MASSIDAAPTGRPSLRTPVAIYVRISSDPKHDGLGVKREERECRELCRRLGLRVVAVFLDDDRSAFSGKPRPGYLGMLERLQLGDFQAIVAWHPDRLHRSPLELESFIDLLERTRATVVTVQGGDYDLSTASGRMTARVVGAVARHESEHKSERLRAKMRELVGGGRMTGGTGNRAFGYEQYEKGTHQPSVREEEAAIVRELVERYLAGESLIGLARDLNRRRVSTVTGSRWRVTTVRGLLGSPRLAGLREYQGQLVASPWPAIIDADQYHRLRARLQANAKSHRRAARRYLLTGIVCCGRDGCGQPLVGRTIKSTSTHRNEPRYVCARERGGCGGISILALPVEERVTEALFDVVDSPEFAHRLWSEDGQPPETQDEVEKVERRLAVLAQTWADGDITRAEWQAARGRLLERLDALQRRLGEATRHSVLERWKDGDRSLRREWSSLSLDQKRAIAAAVLRRVVIQPSDRSAPRRFDSRRVTIERKF